MSLRKLNSAILAAMMILAAVSCNDDDDTQVSPSLNGSLRITVPAFVGPESVVNMKHRGVTHPEGNGIGYYWKVSPVMTKSDTTRLENGLDKDGKESDGHFTYKFPDSLGTYTISCSAFASGYATSSGKAYIEVVKGGIDGSITGIDFSGSGAITIEGKTYPVTRIGGTEWLRRNIATAGTGLPYQNCRAMDDVLGRYYSWEEAVRICPQGWRLPTDEDWAELAKAAGASGEHEKFQTIPGVAAAIMGDAEFNGTRMWEYWPEVGEITDAQKTSMLPAGFVTLGSRSEQEKVDEYKEYNYPNAAFKGIREYAVFWTGDKVEGEEGKAYYRYLIADQPDLMISKGDINAFGASVRCVRDAQ